MAATAPDRHGEQLLLRVQDLQSRLDAAGDSPTRRVAEELLATVIDMYGEGLQRVVATLHGSDEGERLAAQLADDELVSSLLLIHDVHPVPLRERVAQALEQVRPYMESHGGDVELLSLRDGVARIRLRGSCSDCAASAVTLELAIKQALEASAPDLDGLEVEGAGQDVASSPPPAGPALPLVPADGAGGLPMVMSAPGNGSSSPPPHWVDADHLALIPPGRLVATEVGGTELMVANVDGTLLAYANTCAGCGEPLDGGELLDGTLTCTGCGRAFFLPAAGRSMDDERLQLAPFPLLCEQGNVRVALRS
ncbi:MAG TPA: NifU family protein [Solirubrobacteraceae bacterium]|jgi:Fe-S cluster biogenesis protein NfuA/nitrite reductase/ring-hydroxylating ferredoxin subunit|nr:NifU family protein [Solirubrobacteraceae bacterium]